MLTVFNVLIIITPLPPIYWAKMNNDFTIMNLGKDMCLL